MQCVVYAKGTDGVPTTTQIADLSDRMPQISYTHAALWGPLAATVEWGGTLDEGFAAADQWLGNPIEIWSPDGEWLWEGIIWSVTFGAGTRTRTRSLEGYANRVIVHWSDYTTGAQGAPVESNDTVQQSVYGIIEYQHNAGRIVASTASAIADQQLSLRSRLLYLPGGGGSSSVRLECVGRYRTLGYRSVVSTTPITDTTSSCITTILTAAAPSISIGIAPTAGTTTRIFDLYETALEIIKRLVGELPDYVFGIGRGGVAYLEPSQRLSTTETYVERTDGMFEDTVGNEVAPWLIRPDTIVRQVDFVPTSIATGAALDAIENLYIAEVTVASDGTFSYSASVAGVSGEVEPY